MQKYIRLVTGLYAFILALVIFNLLTFRSARSHKPLTPIDEGFSVLAATDKKAKDYTVYGFLPYWKLGEIPFIQTDSLTDIAYFALSINSDGTIQKRTSEGYTEPGYNQWRNSEQLDRFIKNAKSKDIDVALTIISHDDNVSDTFLSCTSCWETMVKELKTELAHHDIKDVNIDFEYGSYTDSQTANQYTNFVKYVNKELDKEYGDSKVVVSTFADSLIRPRVTKVEDLALVSDGIFIMAYDFHVNASDTAGPIAPIKRVKEYTFYDLETMLSDYLSQIPANKLILGVPYYGRNWVVDSSSPYATRLIGNPWSGYSITQTYDAVINTIRETNSQVLWDESAQTPYFSYLSPDTGAMRMVYFENAQSLQIKYQLAKNKGLQGVGIWALGYDGGYQELWDVLRTEFVL